MNAETWRETNVRHREKICELWKADRGYIQKTAKLRIYRTWLIKNLKWVVPIKNLVNYERRNMKRNQCAISRNFVSYEKFEPQIASPLRNNYNLK